MVHNQAMYRLLLPLAAVIALAASDDRRLSRRRVVADAYQGASSQKTNPKTTAKVEPRKSESPKPGQTLVNQVDQQIYVYIPPGKFTMGCSKGDRECIKDELPPHEVEITRGFWIGQTEVTQAAYIRVVKADPSRFKGHDRPVERVNWEEAKAYCEAVKMRLPTEAEWEYAARAGSETARYSPIEDIARYGANSYGGTQRVAGKTPNAWGLYDTLGNVREWVSDWYGAYSAGQAADPRGPSHGRRRVVRGGAWNHVVQVVRVSARPDWVPSARFDNVGFRCAGDLPR